MDTSWNNPPGGPSFPPPYEPPQRGGGCGKVAILLAIVGAAGVLGTIGCCGGLMFWFKGEMSNEIQFQLEGHPAVQEHVGEIRSFDMDIMASGAVDGEDVWVYDVEGTKGKAIITAEHITAADGSEEIISARMRLPSGETVELVP